MTKTKATKIGSNLDPLVARKVSLAVKDYLSADSPPADKIICPVRFVKEVEDMPEFFQACAVTEVNWTNRTVKKHSTIMRFKLTVDGKINRSSLHYYP